MSETATEESRSASTAYRNPEQEQAVKGRGVAPADEFALDGINPLNAHLFRENRWQRYFERLRNEDPVHFNELESAGRYWSVTNYDDIKAVSSDWQTFSSAKGITLGFRVGSRAPNMFQQMTRPALSVPIIHPAEPK
jgi:cytochrome P450